MITAVFKITKWGEDAVMAKGKAAVEDALFNIGEMVVRESRNRCPKDTGALRASAHATLANAMGTRQPVVIVSYDTPYARRQHEDTTLRHSIGGPKFLENAVKDNQGEIESRIGTALGKAF